MNSSQQPDAEKDLVRKPYSKPQIQVYGDLREITKTVSGSKNTPDGGPGPGNPKT